MIGKQKKIYHLIVKIDLIQWKLKKIIKEIDSMIKCNFVQDGKLINELNKIGILEFQVKLKLSNDHTFKSFSKMIYHFKNI